MERLTSNKNISEMNMYELAHNSCYGKDGNARFRDFENDFDARELTIKLLEKYADIPNEFTCDEDFEDFIADALQYGTDDILGLIAVFYRNLWAMADLRETLKEYEDLGEQGKLLKLPCAVGDTVYRINKGAKEPILEMKVVEVGAVSLRTGDLVIQITCRDNADGGETSYLNIDFGNIIFLTREEAEAALKELEG